MNLGELRSRLRIRLDDTAEPYLYDDDTLRDALNDAVRQAAIRKRLVLDRSTSACCRFAVAIDQSKVRMHPRMLAIRTARWSGAPRPLLLRTLKMLERDYPDWPQQPAQETPAILVVDADTGSVMLWPTPSEAGTLELAIWRAPLDAEELEDEGDDPLVDELFHIDLLDWAEHYVYLTKDGEAGDPQRAAAAEQRFTQKFGPQPNAHSMKLWGLSPRRGQRAHFD